MKQFVPAVFLVSALEFGVIGAAPVIAECIPVQGKILNNAINPDTTLGVVAMNYGVKKSQAEKKLKCAISGIQQPAQVSNIPVPLQLNFTHTISCDDSDTLYSGQPIHSRIVLNTVGAFTGGDGASFATFEELSRPLLYTGSGLFDGVVGGEIHVKGTFFFITGAIDMEFEGNVCY